MIEARTTSADATRAFGAALATVVGPNDLVLLCGEMGSGKTTFTQGFGRALGVDELITSPTFVLVRSYDGARLPLHHADVYRLDHLQEVIDLGLPELLDEGGVALVEWGDVAQPVLPSDHLEVRFERVESDDDARRITVEASGASWSSRRVALTVAVETWRDSAEAHQ